MNLRKNPRFSALMTAENSQYEVGMVEHWTGVQLDEDWQKYTVHFWGAENGNYFWSGLKNKPNVQARYDFAQEARSNRFVFYSNRGRGPARTYQQMANWFEGKFGTGLYSRQFQIAAYRAPQTDNGVRYAGQTRGTDNAPTTQLPNTPGS